jgi:hypothetical protein
MDNINVLEKQLAQRQFEDILDQFNILSEWVNLNFTDVDFSVEFNDDSQNPAGPAFHIKTRLFTGTDMTPEDRLLKKNVITITPEIWDNTVLMMKFIKNIVPSFQKSIAKEVNDYYQRNKNIRIKRTLQ